MHVFDGVKIAEKTVTIKLNTESIIGLNAILSIFIDNVGELEKLTKENLFPQYSIAKSIKDNIGCNTCKHYGKERDCRGCIKCCNGTCCNLEL